VYDYWTLEMVRVWLLNSGTADMLVEVFGDAGAIPDDDDLLYSEMVSEDDYTWTATGDSIYGYYVYEVKIPISGFDISPGTMYWLSLQHQGSFNIFWAATQYRYDWWDEWAFYYQGAWIAGGYCYFRDQFFELHGSLTDHVDPDITQTFPHDSDFPSGVPVDTNVTFHVIDDVTGCDTGETTCTVEENGDPVTGDLTFDDSDPLDVAFTWEADDDYTEGASIDVEVETYDLAGNGPVTEEWTFTTGYVNVTPESLGVIKARFIE
jgi:hypothetical protein